MDYLVITYKPNRGVKKPEGLKTAEDKVLAYVMEHQGIQTAEPLIAYGVGLSLVRTKAILLKLRREGKLVMCRASKFLAQHKSIEELTTPLKRR